MWDYIPDVRKMEIADYMGLWALELNAFRGLAKRFDQADFMRGLSAAHVGSRSTVDKVSGGGPGKALAIVKAVGLLMKGESLWGGTSTIQLRRALRQAAADDDVAGILLAIDSPGGSVAGIDDLGAEVRRARKTKLVYAHIDDCGCSAAYWLASQAEKITANSPTALVGSIGTFQVIYDQSAAAEKEGIKTLLFATGSLKGLGTAGSKVTEEHQAHIQGLVNSAQESFDAAVTAGRKLTPAQLAAVRHGGALTADAAVKAGLVDKIQSLNQTVAKMLARGPMAKTLPMLPGFPSRN